MAWTDLKAAVAAVIRTNGNQEITGGLLQSTLNSIIDQVGANTSYKGEAVPSTTPGSPDGPVFYIASTPGTYANFGGFVLDGGFAVLSNISGSWVGTKFLKIEMDTKAAHGYESNPKTLKQVEDELADELALKIDTTSIKQVLGTSTTDVMSQYSVSQEFLQRDLFNRINIEASNGISAIALRNGAIADDDILVIPAGSTGNNSVQSTRLIQSFLNDNDGKNITLRCVFDVNNYIDNSLVYYIKNGGTGDTLSTGVLKDKIDNTFIVDFNITVNKSITNTQIVIQKAVTEPLANELRVFPLYVFLLDLSLKDQVNQVEKIATQKISQFQNEFQKEVVYQPIFSSMQVGASKRCSELYLEGLDPSKKYYCKWLGQYVTTGYAEAHISIFSYTQDDKSDEVKVAGYLKNGSTPQFIKGIIRVSQSNSSGISGYALLNIDSSVRDETTAEINIDVVSNIEFSPAIKSYINSNDIDDLRRQKIPNFLYTKNNILNSRIKELYIKGDIDKTKYYYVYNCGVEIYGGVKHYQFYIGISDTQNPSTWNRFAYYDSTTVVPNKFIQLNCGIEGVQVYAILDFKETDNVDAGRFELIDIESATILDYSPVIKQYLDTPTPLYRNFMGINEPVEVSQSINTSYPDIKVTLNPLNSVKVRTKYDNDRDIIIKSDLSQANKVVRMQQVWVGDKILSDAELETIQYLFYNADDSNPPVPTLNYRFLGGNHGLYTLKIYATGKTKADIGSVYHSSNAEGSSTNYGDFTLVDVDTNNGIMWLAPIIYEDDTLPYPYRKWTVNRPVGNTFTWVSGGATNTDITASGVVYSNAAQYKGTAKLTKRVFKLDGEIISDNDVYTGKHFVIEEEYNIINPNDIQSYPNMIAGSLARLKTTYEYIGCVCMVHSDLEAIEDVYLEYYAPVQPTGFPTKDSKVAYFMMPKTNAYSGLTLVADVSGSGRRNSQTLIDVDKLPDRALWCYKEGNDFTLAYASGLSIIHGDSRNEIRKVNLPKDGLIYQISKDGGWCKVYPYEIANGKLERGKHIVCLGYFSYFAPSSSIFEYNTFEGDAILRYVHIIQDNTSNYQIDLTGYNNMQIIECSAGLDYSISGNAITISGNEGDYIVISMLL